MPLDEQPLELAEQLVNEENPWPGLSAFTEENALFFHGRNDETADLLQLVKRKVLTVQLGQSGLGKTSLLQAGLFPRLRREDFLPVYVRLNHADDAPDLVSQIKEALRQAGESARADVPRAREDESLWEYFHREENDFWSEKNRILVPVLVFDQFEEIFTLASEGENQQRRVSQLLAELANLIENRPTTAGQLRLEGETETAFDRDKTHYKIIFSLREDFLANLEDLKNKIPSITHNRLRLTMMNGRQALQSVVQTGGGLVDEDVAARIVELVAVKGAAAPDDLSGLEIEPTLLSVFCRELNTKRLRRRDAKITADLIVGSKDDILREFYARAVQGFDSRVQHFIEERLLTSSGYRNNVAIEDALTQPGIDRDVIATLINRRLFRVEHAARTPRLELTHDVLTEVIKTSRDERREKEAVAEAERREREVAGQLRRKEEELRLTKRRNAILLGACGAVILLAAVSFLEYLRAQLAEVKTERSFRGADGLIDFMLVDLPEKLEPVGQLKVLEDTAQRVIDYQARLPIEVVSDRNRQMRLAQACNFQGNIFLVEGALGKAQEDYQKALDIMQPLVDRDGASNDFKGELAHTLYNQAALIFAQDTPGRLEKALDKVEKCLAVAQTTTKPTEDIRWNRFLIRAWQLKGRILTYAGDFKNALPSFQQSIDLIGRNTGDPQGPFDRGVTYHLMGKVFAPQDEFQEAEHYYQLGIDQLSGVSAGDTRALYELSTAYNSLAALYHRQNAQDKALAVYQQSLQTLTILTQLDSKNKTWLHALTTVYGEIGRIYFYNSQFDLATESLQKGLEGARKLVLLDPTSAEWQRDLALASHYRGDVFMMQNHPAAAGPYYQDALQRLRDLLKKTPNDAPDIDEIIHNEVLLGDVNYFQGKFDEADNYYEASMADHEAALALTPKNPVFHNEYAWDFCTCPSAKIRQGARALQEVQLGLQLMKEANAKTDDYNILDTLAAAYAENGDFKDAVATEKHVVDLAGTSGRAQLDALKARLQLYEQGRPYHRAQPRDAFF